MQEASNCKQKVASNLFVQVWFGGVPSAVEEVVRAWFCCLLSLKTNARNRGRTALRHLLSTRTKKILLVHTVSFWRGVLRDYLLRRHWMLKFQGNERKRQLLRSLLSDHPVDKDSFFVGEGKWGCPPPPQITGVSQSARETSRDKSQSVPSPEELFKT